MRRAHRASRSRHAPGKRSHPPTLLAFNKPFGVLCQFRRDGNRSTLADYIDLPGVYPAGRLDRDSEGLMVLTDNGRLQHQIADPRHKLTKTYLVQVEGEIDRPALDQLQDGIELKDGAARALTAVAVPPPTALWPRTPPVRYRASIPTSWLKLCIDEGRNRQVRRMSAAVGFPTLRLVRIAIGSLTVWQLAPGCFRQITPDDLGLARQPRDSLERRESRQNRNPRRAGRRQRSRSTE